MTDKDEEKNLESLKSQRDEAIKEANAVESKWAGLLDSLASLMVTAEPNNFTARIRRAYLGDIGR